MAPRREPWCFLASHWSMKVTWAATLRHIKSHIYIPLFRLWYTLSVCLYFGRETTANKNANGRLNETRPVPKEGHMERVGRWRPGWLLASGPRELGFTCVRDDKLTEDRVCRVCVLRSSHSVIFLHPFLELTVSVIQANKRLAYVG